MILDCNVVQSYQGMFYMLFKFLKYEHYMKTAGSQTQAKENTLFVVDTLLRQLNTTGNGLRLHGNYEYICVHVQLENIKYVFSKFDTLFSVDSNQLSLIPCFLQIVTSLSMIPCFLQIVTSISLIPCFLLIVTSLSVIPCFLQIVTS